MPDNRSIRAKLQALARRGTPEERAVARRKLGLPERPHYYILDGRDIVGVDSVREWGEFFEQDDKRRVGADTVDEAQVSTVFLGIDHNFYGDGPPILFETMIFGGRFDEFQRRYATFDEAEAGHRAIVDALRHGRQPDE